NAIFDCPDPINNLTSLNKYSIKLFQYSIYNWKAICLQKNNNLINIPFQNIFKYFENEAKNLNVLSNNDNLKKELIKIILDESKRNMDNLNEKQINIIKIINELFEKSNSHRQKGKNIEINQNLEKGKQVTKNSDYNEKQGNKFIK
uniref:RNA-directed DNA polymerase n=1 Tax=Meloidogyne hapla TaxID=6305 RepID=A0A1I8AWI1_MELHA